MYPNSHICLIYIKRALKKYWLFKLLTKTYNLEVFFNFNHVQIISHVEVLGLGIKVLQYVTFSQVLLKAIEHNQK